MSVEVKEGWGCELVFRIEQLRGGRTDLRFEGDLAELVVGSGSGGFGVEEDEHGDIVTVFG